MKAHLTGHALDGYGVALRKETVGSTLRSLFVYRRQ